MDKLMEEFESWMKVEQDKGLVDFKISLANNNLEGGSDLPHQVIAVLKADDRRKNPYTDY